MTTQSLKQSSTLNIGPNRDARAAAALASRFAPPTTQLIPPLSSDAPTVALNTSATITGARATSMMSTTELNLLGTRGTWDAPYSRLRVGSNVTPGFETMFYGTAMELVFDTNSGGAQNFWIFVDGLPITSAPTSYGNVTAGNRYYLSLTWTAANTRRVEVFGESILAFLYISTSWNAALTAPPRKPVVGFVFDSFGAGAATDTYLSAPFLISRQLGVECINASLGGTGYVNPGSFSNTFGCSARVSSVSPANPELIIVSGSVNDDSYTGVQSAAASTYAAYLAACPQAKIIVFGNQPSNSASTLAANRAANNAALKSAALSAPNVIAYHDMIGTANGIPPAWSGGGTHTDGDLVTYNGSVWRWMGPTDGNSVPSQSSRWELLTYVYTGTGNSGTTAGNGNRDYFLASDGVHPTTPGSAAFAIAQAAAIRADLKALAVS